MNKLASRSSALVFALVLSGAALGCSMQQRASGSLESSDQATQLLSSDGEEAVASNDQSADALSADAFESAPSADPTAAADALVGMKEEGTFARCRTRAKDPNDPGTVIITLKDCTGRFGYRQVSGKEIVKFTQGEGGVLHADFHSEDLTVNGKPASHTASAEITFEGTERHIAWKGAWERTTEKAAEVKHQSDLTIVVDTVAHCRTRNGTASTTVGSRGIETQFEDLKICHDGDGLRDCPSGTVTHTAQLKDRSISVRFDGSNQAEVTTAQGKTFDLPLLCQE